MNLIFPLRGENFRSVDLEVLCHLVRSPFLLAGGPCVIATLSWIGWGDWGGDEQRRLEV